MSDHYRTREQLINELNQMSIRISELEAAQIEVDNITGRKQAMDSLQKTQENYTELVELTNSIILRWDRRGKIIFLNKFGQTFFGYSAEEILGRNAIGTIVPETDQAGHDMVQMIRDISAYPDRYEKNQNENMRRNGERVWISWTNKPIFDEHGNVKEVLSIGNDHTDLRRAEEELRKSKDELEARVAERTAKLRESNEQLELELVERKRAEDALRQSERKYRLLVDNAPIGILLVNAKGEILEVNRCLLEILGSPGPEATKSINMLTFPPLVEAGVSGPFRTCMTEGKPVSAEIPYKSKWGRQSYLRVILIPKFNEKGEVEGCQAVTEDVMPRKLAEQAQKESEEKYRIIFRDAPVGMMSVSNTGGILDANNRMLEILDSPGLEHTRKINVLTFPPIIEAGIAEHYMRCFTKGIPADFENSYTTKWGKKTYLRSVITPRFNEKGEIVGCLTVIEDVMPRKLAEQALRHSEDRYRNVLKSSPDPIVVYDQVGGATYVNPAFEKIFGWSEEELLGKRIDYVPEEEKPKVMETLKLLYERKIVPSLETKRLTKDGNRLDVNISAALVTDDTGKPVGNVVTLRDVTQEKSLRAQLLQAQKMEAIGTLAGGIAHDFNNLLQVVLGYSEVMLKRKKEGEKDYSELQKVNQAGKRGADLVRRLLTFSRKVEPNFAPVNLNHEILQVQNLLSRTIPKTITIDLHLSGNLESIQADPSQIGQILMNLGVNARDAMPDGGALTFETANVQLEEEYCNNHLEVKPGSYALLTVSDTGQGMDKETLTHIFEPFFSTKEVGKGTGLGLATVYGIVKQHDGHIMCYSEPGHGTTFKIYFPAIQTEKLSETPKFETEIPGGTETILLVEDDAVISELCGSLLESFGYEVILAGNGKEALAIYKNQSARISLVILDLIMPEMDGRQCLGEILRVDPQAKVLIASGYSENEPSARRSLNGAKGLVKKPYDMTDLLNAVREILDNY